MSPERATGQPAERGKSLRLKDRVVLVTGAAGTIGKEVSRVLAAHGARLALTDLAAAPLESLVHEFENPATATWGRPSDTADFEDFSGLVADTRDALGPVEILVNVAGLFKIADFVDSKPPDWSEMIAANLLTAIVACRSVLPDMVEAQQRRDRQFCLDGGRVRVHSAGSRLRRREGGCDRFHEVAGSRGIAHGSTCQRHFSRSGRYSSTTGCYAR